MTTRPTTTPTRVGLLGLGRMGRHFATHLAQADFDLTLYNRTSQTAQDVSAATGSHAATTPREVAERSEVVILMLADGAALAAVLEGPDGLLAGLSPGGIVIDMGTSGPEAVAAASSLVQAAGCVLVDAPVSGSTATAEAAALLIMAGGPTETIAELEPIFACLGKSVHHMGPTGTASAMKLAVNGVVFAINQSIAESLVLAEQAGIDRSAAYDVFAASAVAAPIVTYRRGVFEHPETTPVSFSIDLARKDLGLILELATAVDAPMPQAVANLETLDAASQAGLGPADMGQIATHLRAT